MPVSYTHLDTEPGDAEDQQAQQGADQGAHQETHQAPDDGQSDAKTDTETGAQVVQLHAAQNPGHNS